MENVTNVEGQNFSVSVQQPVLCPVVSPVPFVLNVRGQSQKKDGSPSSKVKQEINFVKGVFSVDHCVFATIVPNAHNVVNAQLIGGRLQKFWQKWSLLGANPRVVSILKDGYILPFKNRPPLVRDPLIVSGYANPLRNLYLKEALHALLQKEAIEMVRVRTSLAFETCRVRNVMSLIGLLTATEKQVPLGRFHMRPIQWHLKRHWRAPESLEKEIPVPRPLHSHLLWWTKKSNVLIGQPLHPLCHAIQIFTDASKEGWGAHLGDFTVSGTWSVRGSHLHVNFLELKAVLLALKRFQHLVQGKVVLVATDNTTVVAYINKEGGMRSGSLCTLLWRLLCWCNLRQVVLKARHIPGCLNVIADKLSRLGQIIQTEWSLHQVFNLLVQTWHLPQVQLQTSPIRVSSAGPQCVGSGRSNSLLGEPGHVCLSPSVVTGQGGQQTIGPSLQESDPNSPGLAQHAMVLGSGGTVVPDSSLPTHSSRPSGTAIQQGSSQESDQSKPSRLASRAEAINEQGFSSPVAS